MRCVELFAGAGGAALGLRAAGFDGPHVEWSADACATLRRAGFSAWNGDVRTWVGGSAALNGSGLPLMWRSSAPASAHHGADLLWSSFPCQAWSQAGHRKGAQDDRNGWPWTIDAIDAIEPRWVVCENVRGLTTHRDAARCVAGLEPNPNECPRCYLDGVIMPQLRERYPCADWQVLNAADYGVPQTRHRVFIVAGPRPIKWPEATHGPTADRPWVSCGEALGLTFTIDGSRNTEANPTQERVRPSTIGTKGNAMARIIGGGRNPGSAGEARSYRDLTDGPSTTIAAQSGGGAGNAGPYYERADGNTRINRASCALHAATGRRRLTVEECAILQGFPDGYPFQGNKGSRYRQVGNAVPPKLAEVMARAVREADENP